MIGLFARRLWLACWLWLPLVAGAQLQHRLEVRLEPDRHRIEVLDRIVVSGMQSASLTFALHPDLKPESLTPGVRLVEIPATRVEQVPALNVASEHAVLIPRHYRVELQAGEARFTLRYAGRIQHALQQQGEEYARGFRETPGVISPLGVFLASSSFWYPHVDGELLTFDLELRLPRGWKGMTQGERLASKLLEQTVTEHWRCSSPQEELYLIAGRFEEYQQRSGVVQALVLLREPAPALAQKYLDATEQYIKLYSELLGPYAYTKFALVENFWETGYGMPSFTLLGPKVIRFPFILHSSYPHEILHNWWGNGVYVDYASGNWAEGLTSYLADHLIKEQRGKGVEYRRTTLQKYTDYVRRQKDFPLTQFRSRHSARSEAVGYGKTLMLFHMLRRRLGDEHFVQGLRELYKQYLFRVADFAAVEKVFSDVAQQPLDDFFQQWVQRRGAPELRILKAQAKVEGEKYLLSAVIEQSQAGAPYTLQVPVAIQLEGQEQAYQTQLEVDEKRTVVEMTLPARPLVLHVDPEFDLFRRLHRGEIPPAISQAMGAERVLLVLPSDAPQPLLHAYRSLAETWQAGHSGQVEIVLDRDLQQLPADRTVWLFGWRNRHRPRLKEALAAYDYNDGDEWVRIGQTELRADTHTVVVLGRQPENPDQALGWLAVDQAGALPGLGRKLPHYGRYSYLAFTGETPDNVFKGQWPVVDSPMSLRVMQSDGVSPKPPPLHLAPRIPLIAEAEKFSTRHLQLDLDFLANDAMAGRGLGSPELDRAAHYIARQFRAAGLQPLGTGEDAYLQVWEQAVEGLQDPLRLTNVVGVLPGSDPRISGESLVIGAHYDHLGRGGAAAHKGDRGRIHPGADDNASGVAVLLELARVLAGAKQPRTILFVAFTGEEHGRLGSRYYLHQSTRYPPDKIIAMLNLDTVGRLGDKPLIVFGTGSAQEWVHIFRGASYLTGVPVKSIADDFGSSDQTSFIEAGIPAVQLFGGTHQDIHRPGDTLDKLDVPGLVKVARVVYEAATYLTERPEAMQTTLGAARVPAAIPAAAGGRHVSLGTVPDFTFQGEGVRIDDIRDATPAAQAGLRKGDIIVGVNERPVRGMRQYAEALRQLNPGDEIRLRLLRDEKEYTLSTRVVERQ